MHRRTACALLSAALLTVPVAGATAQHSGSDGPISIGLSPIGFTPTPATYLFAFDAFWHINDDWAVGPMLQIGPRTGGTLLSFYANGRYYFDFLNGTFLNGLDPYATAGLGVVVTLPSFGPNNSEFGLNMGFGGEYPITDHLYLGSSFIFNVAPGAAVNSFVFSWQFAQLRYRF